MNFTRRRLLILLALLVLGDFGRSVFIMRAGTPPGWKTERWQAGFGSWGNGGYGVAYDISMPKDYDFTQKCGRAWIADDVDAGEDGIRLYFAPDAKDREADFALYVKDDVRLAYDVDPAALRVAAKASAKIGRLDFDRTGFALDDAKGHGDRATGFWLSGEKLSIISDLRDPGHAAINERIVASMRRANGYGFTELVFGTIPGLLGC